MAQSSPQRKTVTVNVPRWQNTQPSRVRRRVISIKVTERNGLVVGAVQVDDCDQIMMITDAGTLVRTRVSEISIVGRNTGRDPHPYCGR